MSPDEARWVRDPELGAVFHSNKYAFLADRRADCRQRPRRRRQRRVPSAWAFLAGPAF